MVRFWPTLYSSDKLLHFETRATQKWLKSNTEAKFGTFWPPVKFRRAVRGEMSESVFRVRPRTRPLIYFCRGSAARQSARLESVWQKERKDSSKIRPSDCGRRPNKARTFVGWRYMTAYKWCIFYLLTSADHNRYSALKIMVCKMFAKPCKSEWSETWAELYITSFHADVAISSSLLSWAVVAYCSRAQTAIVFQLSARLIELPLDWML